MANLKDIRKRIISVANTQKITKAMKMVSAAKLRRAKDEVLATRPYAAKLVEVIEHLAERVDTESHPLLREPEKCKRGLLLVITSDRGLCGGYNSNVNKAVLRFLEERAGKYETLELTVVGRKGREFLRHRKIDIDTFEEQAWKEPNVLFSQRIAKDLCERFADGGLDEVFVLYTRFKSAIAQEVVLDRVLPLRLPEHDGQEVPNLVEYLYEPSASLLFDELLPKSVVIHVQRAMLESLASEYGARMTAMDSATTNAGEMIESLTLQYNRARQAAITKELIEIISGADAL